MKKILCAALLLTFPAHAVAAADAPRQWQVDYAHSRLGFEGEQNGQKFTGGFGKFAARIALDPGAPENNGKIVVTVDIASATAGSSDRDGMLPQKEWFDSAHFPQAQFVSTAIRKTGPFKYEADGTLTLKGLSHKLTLSFTLAPDGDHWRAQGRTVVMRNDFAIGSGSYSSEAYVKNAVAVLIDIEAQ